MSIDGGPDPRERHFVAAQPPDGAPQVPERRVVLARRWNRVAHEDAAGDVQLLGRPVAAVRLDVIAIEQATIPAPVLPPVENRLGLTYRSVQNPCSPGHQPSLEFLL